MADEPATEDEGERRVRRQQVLSERFALIAYLVVPLVLFIIAVLVVSTR